MHHNHTSTRKFHTPTPYICQVGFIYKYILNMNIKFASSGTNIQSPDNTLNPNPIIPTYKFDARCSYGAKNLNLEKATEKEINCSKFGDQTPANTRRKTINDFRTISQLKASGQTTDTSKNSGCKQSTRREDSKNTLKMDEIGNLLSEFKNKFAHIQQKYSIPVKTKEATSHLKFQPMTPQHGQFSSKFDSSSNKLFFDTSKKMNSRTPHYSSNNTQTFSSSEDQQNFRYQKSDRMTTIKQKLSQKIQQAQIYSPEIEKKTVDRSKFRATFGPVKCREINVPIRQIKQAQQAMVRRSKFQNCKDVQSQVEQDQEQEQMFESVVIEKFSTQWKKLRRTETFSPIVGQFNEQPSDAKNQSVKRFQSLRSPF